jgi:hypothetical protein
MANKKAKNAAKAPSKRERLVRNRRISITLNEKEFRVMERFFKECKIKNKSKFLRDTLIRLAWQKLDENAPYLFSEEEMC